ncbi:MAG: hypothetical protein IPP47_00360 [Bryobacterales bacterium]|nr:hypothetical protein [Bryobacterales bacterium]
MLALVLLGLLATLPDVVLLSEPSPAAPIVARSIPADALRTIQNTQLGAAVYTIRGGWYYVSIGAKQKAWLHKTPQMVFHLISICSPATCPFSPHAGMEESTGPSVTTRPPRPLSKGLSQRKKRRSEDPGQSQTPGGLWFQIETPVADHCGALPPKLRPAKGWIPAYAPDGEPNLWFASDGC